MNAFYLCMVFIFINAGIVLVAGLNIFGNDLVQQSFLLSAIFSVNTSEATITAAVVGIGVMGLASALALAASKVNLLTNIQGVAIGAFATVFWISFGSALDILLAILSVLFPEGNYGNIVFGIFFATGVFIFIMALVQFAAGGVKTHG